MRLFRSGSVAGKLILATLAFLAVVNLLSGLHSVFSERSVLLRQIDAQGNSLATLTSVCSIESLLTQDYPLLQTLSDQLTQKENGVAFVRILRTDGQMVAETRSLGADFKFRLYSAKVRVTPDDQRIIGQVEIGILTKASDDLITSRLRTLGLQSFFVFLVLALLQSLLIEKTVGRRLTELSRQADALGHDGDLEHEISLMGSDELSRLAENLNAMRVRIKDYLKDLDQAKEKAEEANKAKTAFLNMMSHEMRTPLTVILGFLEEFEDLEMLKGMPIEEVHEYLGMSLAESQKLLSIVDDVLDMTRIEGNRLPIYPVPVLAFAVVDEAVYDIKGMVAEKKLALKIEEIPVDLMVQADPKRLRQILVNLLDNAVKFTKSGRITVVAKEKGEFAIFTITDTGCGIPPEKQELIFDAFERVDASLTSKSDGMGLGLALCRRLTEMQGGEISVKSQLEQGSTFSFSIPLQERR